MARMKSLLLICFWCIVPGLLFSQVRLDWQKRIHPERSENLRSVQKDPAGGFVVLSTKAKYQPDSSFIRWYNPLFEERRELKFRIDHNRFEPSDFLILSSGDIAVTGSVQVSASNVDFGWLLLDTKGSQKQFLSFGGNGIDSPREIVQADDGSLFIAGRSNSGISGVKKEVSRGGSDYWVVQINERGELLDQKTLGGNHDEYLTNMVVNKDGSRLIWGNSQSIKSGDKETDPRGQDDGWIIQTDSLWQSVHQASTGGAGNDAISSSMYKKKDQTVFLCREGQVDSGGEFDIVLRGYEADDTTPVLKHLKANANDSPGNMIRTCDGGYVICAASASGRGGDKSEASYGGSDIWIIRMDKDFNIIWDKTIGGTVTETFPSLFRIGQREYVVVFSSQSLRSGNLDQENPMNNIGLYVIGLTDESIPDHWFNRLWKGCNICGSIKRISKEDVIRFRVGVEVPVAGSEE